MKEIDLTDGSIFKKLIKFSLPMIVGNFLQQIYNLADTLIVGKYIGAKYLRIEGAMYVGIGILFLWYGYFRGINKPHISLILTIISLGTRVVLSYALAPTTPLGVIAIWLSIPIGWVLADVVGYFYYRKNKL